MQAEENQEKVIKLKKLSKEERDKIRRAIKKKRRKKKSKFRGLESQKRRNLLEVAKKIMNDRISKENEAKAAEEAQKIEIEEEDEYEVAGKMYEEFKHVFAQYRTKRVENSDESEEEDVSLISNSKSCFLAELFNGFYIFREVRVEVFDAPEASLCLFGFTLGCFSFVVVFLSPGFLVFFGGSNCLFLNRIVKMERKTAKR